MAVAALNALNLRASTVNLMVDRIAGLFNQPSTGLPSTRATGAASGTLTGGSGGAIQSMIGALPGIAGLIGKIVGSFNAPSARLFANTLNDIHGVIGNALVPVFRIFNTVARAIGDVLATISPFFMELFEGIESSLGNLSPIMKQVEKMFIGLGIAASTLWKTVFKFWEALIKLIGQQLDIKIEDIADAFEALSKVLVGLVVTITELIDIAKSALQGKDVANRFDNFWKKIKDKTNQIWNQAGMEKRSSVGAGQYGVNWTDLETYGKNIRASAWQMSQGKEDIPKKQLDALNDLNKQNKQNADDQKKQWDKQNKQLDQLNKNLGGGPKDNP